MSKRAKAERSRAPVKDPVFYRAQHHPLGNGAGPAVERQDRQQKDSQGRIASGLAAHDTLSALHRNSAIDKAQEIAGRRFEEDFYQANLDPLRAADPERLPIQSAGPVTPIITTASYRVDAAVVALGGPASQATSIVWEVLGKGVTLKKYSDARHGLNCQVAKGLMVAALDVLVGHYRLRR